MKELPNMEEIWSNESPPELSNLRSLQVMLCKSLSKVINFGSLVKLHKLHYLCIRDCNSVQEIFDLDRPNANGDVKTLSSELTTLELYNLGSLRCIWNKNHCGRVSFLHLERLEAHVCPNLKFMFFPSMVKSLGQLRDLSVKHCNKMEAIIMEELGLETSKTMVFPMLTNLNLQHLESLMCFSRGKHFSLAIQMVTFFSSNEKLMTGSREARSQDHIKSSSNALFCQQVVLPSLETLNITGLDNIEMIWDNQVAANSFPKLKSLFVDKCNKVVTVVPSSILGQLLCLESLKANTCGSLEVVFELRPLNSIDGPQVAVPLKKLMVSRLPKLKCVWKKELTHQVNFQCLHSISVFDCKSLTSLFPASIAKDLVQLEELEINGCGIMELIEKEEGLVPTFDFPKLTSLKLKHLTELKCIYTETHVLHWPTLKTLQVYDCNKLEIFALQLENEMLLHKQPLLLIEKVRPEIICVCFDGEYLK
ncbi:hypothetical protein EUGRSUZ_G00714 [Eucalyptus grandis]|uniref:Uncharacterized protein n=2 Tax=Eucalyptus grandis TaxID=71139 RepID=A0ACC3K1K6_EUCGR|nr:hypothetical protein EUGRSUZ_G00714 [Eucalyptus grandis]